jgi:hypothetical protein
MATHIDTSYRLWPAADLAALRLSVLTQLKALEGVGQNHTVSGRSTAFVDFDKLTNKLASLNAAIEWQANVANTGNKAFASRYASFNNCG